MQTEKLIQKITKSYANFLECGIRKEKFPLVFSVAKISVKWNEKRINEEQMVLKRLTEKHEWLILNTVSTQKGTLVESVEFRDTASYLKYLWKTKDWKNFCDNMEAFEAQSGEVGQILKKWALKNTDKINRYHIEWADIILCVKYFLLQKRSDLYFRELPLSVHSKFVENHKKLIENILDFIHAEISDEGFIEEGRDKKSLSFEQRYGIKTKTDFVRFRFLDENLRGVYFWVYPDDLSIRIDDFKKLRITNLEKVFILENEINYLTFPRIRNSIAIWGSGFRTLILQDTPWLQEKEIYYFGDLDSHGFKMLSHFRKRFPQTESFLMDRKTLGAFADFIVKGEIIGQEEMENTSRFLTDEEAEVAKYLNTGALRLEQENITQGYIIEVLNSALTPSPFPNRERGEKQSRDF